MAILGKEVLGRSTLRRKTVEVPEWGGEVIIQELNGEETAIVGQGAGEIAKNRDNPDTGKAIRWEALTVCYGWINEDGSKVLSPDDAGQLLAQHGYGVIGRLAKEIRGMSGLGDEASDEAKKNSTTTPNIGSGSA